jgi:hypothetical protein
MLWFARAARVQVTIVGLMTNIAIADAVEIISAGGSAAAQASASPECCPPGGTVVATPECTANQCVAQATAGGGVFGASFARGEVSWSVQPDRISCSGSASAGDSCPCGPAGAGGSASASFGLLININAPVRAVRSGSWFGIAEPHLEQVTGWPSSIPGILWPGTYRLNIAGSAVNGGSTPQGVNWNLTWDLIGDDAWDVPSEIYLWQALWHCPADRLTVIRLAPGVYGYGGVPMSIPFGTKPVRLIGSGPASTFVENVPSDSSYSLIRIENGHPTSSIENLTIRGGTGSPIASGSPVIVGGGIYASDSTITIRDVVFEDNTAQYGGGVYALNSNITFERCAFRNNAATEDGGGFQAFRGSALLTDCTFEDNAAGSRGGGLHLVGGGSHLLLRTDFLDNVSSNDAGGISWVPFGDASAFLALRDCEVRGNTAADDQGGIGIVPDGSNGKISLQGTVACANAPRPNVDGPYSDLGGNTVCDCPGDLTQDGAVNGDDLGVLLAAWGKCASASCPADLVPDGEVNGMDLGALLNDWLGCN